MIRWRGYRPQYDIWYNIKHLDNAAKLIQDYEDQSLLEQPAKQGPPLLQLSEPSTQQAPLLHLPEHSTSQPQEPPKQVPLLQGLPLLELQEPSMQQDQSQKPSAKAPRLLMEANPNDRSTLAEPPTDDAMKPSPDVQPPAGSQRAVAVMIPSPRQAEQTAIDQAKPTPLPIEAPSTNEATPQLRRSQRLAIEAPPIDHSFADQAGKAKA